jgi:hypothetical protein
MLLVTGEYLQAILPNPHYMRAPSPYAERRPHDIIELKKGLYGLNEAGNLWFNDQAGTQGKNDNVADLHLDTNPGNATLPARARSKRAKATQRKTSARSTRVSLLPRRPSEL